MSLLFPSIDPTSRANDRQAEFTDAKAEFQETVEKREAIAQLVDLINHPQNGLDDLSHAVDIVPEKSISDSESNSKQKELTDLMASTKEALEQ